MGIRESLLNTITSVGSSDFVRIVTSAGASSKATLQNVIKSFETGLSAKSSLTNSDYLRVVGSDNNLYKQSLSDVKTFMGNAYVNSLTSFNNLINSLQDGQPFVASVYSAAMLTLLSGGAIDSATAAQVFGSRKNSTITQYQMNVQDSQIVYLGTYNLSTGTVSNVSKIPTRSEIDNVISDAGTRIYNGTDLNTLALPANYKKIRVYYGEDITQMTNGPSAISSAWPFCLICLPIGGFYTKQILHMYGTTNTPNNVYVRTQSYITGGTAWTNWVQPYRKATGSFTLDSAQSGANANGLVIKQSGNVVSVNGYITGLTLTSNTYIGKISGVSNPASYLRLYANVGTNAYSPGTVSYLTVDTDGSINISTSQTGSNMAIYFSLTYIAD